MHSDQRPDARSTVAVVGTGIVRGGAAAPYESEAQLEGDTLGIDAGRTKKMSGRLEVLAPADDCLGGKRRWRKSLLLDIGSTFTKALVIAPDGSILGRAEAPTTIDDDVMDGVCNAVASLPDQAPGPFDWALASSSAAGGLRMASVGLTASLSGKAGALAALGAGAKVIGSEHGYLDLEGVARIEAMRAHLVMLSGGIDGGNARALIHNARMLAELETPQGYVIAGNSDVAGDACSILEGRGRDVRVVANVFPRPGEIAIGDTREAVRDLFLRHITRAKG
ncbi:MAG: glutamate mutase L, partial [Gammaproteobacteria bacterium]